LIGTTNYIGHKCFIHSDRLAVHKSDVQDSVIFNPAMLGMQMYAVFIIIIPAFSSSPPMATRYPSGNSLLFKIPTIKLCRRKK
jgi:hypothetical protein